MLQQQDTIDRGVLLNHELVKPLQECSCRHGASNGGDSSESSSSQIAPQQHGGVIDSIVSQQHTDRQEQSNVGKAHDTQQATQQTHVAQPPAKQPAEPLKVVPTKHEAFDLVRSVLKPLYASKLVSKEQFKAIAQSATHVLVDPIASAGRDVKHVVKDCLTSIGLSQAVLQV